MSFATQSTPSSSTSAPFGFATRPGARLWIRICDAFTSICVAERSESVAVPAALIESCSVLESFSPAPIATSPLLTIERPPAVSTIVATGLVLGLAVFSATSPATIRSAREPGHMVRAELDPLRVGVETASGSRCADVFAEGELRRDGGVEPEPAQRERSGPVHGGEVRARDVIVWLPAVTRASVSTSSSIVGVPPASRPTSPPSAIVPPAATASDPTSPAVS
jgi:hypothetical protein